MGYGKGGLWVFKVVATYHIPGLPYPEELLLQQGAEFIKTTCRSQEEMLAACKDADAIISPTSVQPPFDRQVIEQLTHCRHLASVGIGIDRVDIKTATDHNIVVTYTPFYCLEEVSDHAMALLLALSRKLFPVYNAAKAGEWGTTKRMRREILPPLLHLRGQTLGLIGFGNIARTLVPKARGFGMRVIAYDPFVPKEIMLAHFGVEKVELEELIAQSDFISVHATLTPENRKMLRREHFQRMKPTAYLINTARGALVDEAALIEALEQGWIAGAGLDVLETEPVSPNNPLLQMDNVIISGHTAQFSSQSEEELWRVPVEDVALTLQGKFPRFPVNPQVRESWLHKWGAKQEVKP